MKHFKRVRKWSVILSAISLIVILILFIGGLILSSYYSDIIKQELQEKLAPTVTLDFTSCKINLLTRSIVFENLRGRVQPDSLLNNQHTFKFDEIELSGIHAIKFLSHRKLRINKVAFRNIDVTVDKFLMNDSASTKEKINKRKNFKGLEVGQLKIENLKLVYQNDTLVDLRSTINITASDFNVPVKDNIQLTDIRFTLNESSVDDIFISSKQSLYEVTVNHVGFDENNTISIDSLKLKPKYPKFKFAQKVGKQIDRIEAFIPQIKINHAEVSQISDSTFNASNVHIYSPYLKAFRDQRLPFIKDHDVPLPVALFKRIPFNLKVDTVQIHEASITYEEFPVDGDSSGSISFKDLQASMYHFSNYDTMSSDHIDLDIETGFMGSGLLKASFDLPFNKNKRYTANGTLSDFNLTTLNLTEPLAKMRIVSGVMNSLNFTFNYDENSSTGEVELHYENLKILSLTEKESKTVIDKFKTFLLNTFIIPKKKDENTATEKRKGTIEFNRDPKRSIFNYWWKSFFTGIKSSYGLEKAPKNR